MNAKHDHFKQPDNGISNKTIAGESSWRLSHLPTLDSAETRAFLDLPKAWLEHRQWPLETGLEMKTLWKYIDRHGMSGLFGELIASNLVRSEYTLNAASHRFFSNLLHNENAFLTCRNILRIGKELEICLLILKGPALVYQAYGGAGVRAYGDIDIFVESCEDANRLARGLSGSGENIKHYSRFRERTSNSTEICTLFQGWKLEIDYPVAANIDPMLDYLVANKKKIFGLPDDLETLLSPDPNIHFVYLLLHMVSNHFCSRYIWFIDLVMLARHQKDKLDVDRIQYDLRQTGFLNVASHVSNFCREYIDPAFPVIMPKMRSWNNAFQKTMLEPKMVTKKYLSSHHQNRLYVFHSYCAYVASFYLLGDPGEKPFYINLKAAKRSAARFLYSLELPHDHFLLRFIEVGTMMLILPFAVLVSFSALLIFFYKKKQENH